MGCTQGKWPGEIVSDYGCSSAAVAIVNAAFVGRVHWSFLVRFSVASPLGVPLRTYWASAYGYQAAIRPVSPPLSTTCCSPTANW